jgi:uncharacterized protein
MELRNKRRMTNICYKAISSCNILSCALLGGSLLLVMAFTAYSQVGARPMDEKEVFGDSRVVSLVQAASRGDAAGVQNAIAIGADPNAKGRDGLTPLFFVLSTTRNSAGIQALIKSGADPAYPVSDLGSAIIVAAKGNDTSLLRAMLDAGTNPNARNQSNEPAIKVAVMSNRWENLDLLIDYGADINAVDYGGTTVAITLSSINQYEKVAKLIERGADVSHVAKNGQTIANTLERSLGRMAPASPNYRAALRVKELLQARGVKFPSPTAVELRNQMGSPSKN